MNCEICQEPIRPTEERDGIGRHDGKYEFGYVHDNGPKIRGNPFCDLTCVATPPGPGGRLTDYDRLSMAEARRLTEIRGIEAIRELTGDDDDTMAWLVFTARLQHHLRDLLAIIDRPGTP